MTFRRILSTTRAYALDIALAAMLAAAVLAELEHAIGEGR